MCIHSLQGFFTKQRSLVLLRPALCKFIISVNELKGVGMGAIISWQYTEAFKNCLKLSVQFQQWVLVSS